MSAMQPCDTGAEGSESDDAGMPRIGSRNRLIIDDQDGAPGEEKQEEDADDAPRTSDDEDDESEKAQAMQQESAANGTKKRREKRLSERFLHLETEHSDEDNEEDAESQLSELTEQEEEEEEDEGGHAAFDYARDRAENMVFETDEEALREGRRMIAQSTGSRRVQNRCMELSKYDQERILRETLQEMSDEASEGEGVTAMDVEDNAEGDVMEMEALVAVVADEDCYLSEEAEGYISGQDDNLREVFSEEGGDIDLFEDDAAALVDEGEFVPHSGECFFLPTTSHRVYNLPGNQTGEQGFCQRVVWRLYVGSDGKTPEGCRAVQLRLGEAVYVPLGVEVAGTLPSMTEEQMQSTRLFDVVLSECLIDVYLHSSTQHRGPLRDDGTYHPHWNWRGKLYSHVFAEWNKAERGGKEEVDIAVSSNESLKLKRGAQPKLRVRNGKEARECLLQLILNSLETAKVGLHKLRASAGEASGGCPKTYFHLLGEAQGVRQ